AECVFYLHAVCVPVEDGFTAWHGGMRIVHSEIGGGEDGRRRANMWSFCCCWFLVKKRDEKRVR
ncbi:hypothetical protein, partial [Akkermansia sp.]|uniref:hypothetical protein n=1 Tax=Akkermansia sp. TaxID=1872421 RepID=UPI003A8BE9E6